MGAIEVSQAVGVGRKVRRHPVQDDGDAMLMQVVDQIHEILWRAVARCGGEIASGLVSPGTIERMFHHRQEFHMSKSHALDILREPRRGLAVGQRTIVLLGNAHPGSQVDFIDGVRSSQRVASRTILHTVLITPLVVEVPHYGRRAWRFFVEQANRVGFVDLIAVAVRLDMEFVERTLVYSGNKSFLDAGVSAAIEQIASRTPGVKASNHRDEMSIWSPDAENGASLPITGDQMGTHGFIHAIVTALIE